MIRTAVRYRFLLLVLAHVAMLGGMLVTRPFLVRLDHRYDEAMFQRVTGRKEKLCRLMYRPGSYPTVAPVVLVVAAALAWRRRWVRLGAWAFFITGCGISVLVFKRWFHRVQPLNMQEFPWGSFPSGHTFLATAVYSMIVYFLWNDVPPRRRPWLVAVAGALVLCTALGLLLPGYHFISDVMAGYVVGMLWTLCCIWIIRAVEPLTLLKPPAGAPSSGRKRHTRLLVRRLYGAMVGQMALAVATAVLLVGIAGAAKWRITTKRYWENKLAAEAELNAWHPFDARISNAILKATRVEASPVAGDLAAPLRKSSSTGSVLDREVALEWADALLDAKSYSPDVVEPCFEPTVQLDFYAAAGQVTVQICLKCRNLEARIVDGDGIEITRPKAFFSGLTRFISLAIKTFPDDRKLQLMDDEK